MTLRESAQLLRSREPISYEDKFMREVLAMLCERVAEIAPAADRPLED